jgi:hypothetical protein
MLKTSMVGPLGGGAEDLGAPTINARNIDGGPPWGGGSGLHPGSKRCVVNLHGQDRQKVILLTSPTSPHLVLLWMTILTQFMGHGFFSATLSRLWLWPCLGACAVQTLST